MKIKPVKWAKAAFWDREIEDQEMSVGTENARHFRECRLPGFHISQAKGDGDGIEASRREWEMKRIGLDQPFHFFSLCDAEHGQTEVGAHDDGVRASALEGAGQVTRPGCKIQDRSGGPTLYDIRRTAPPNKIKATAEQVVGEIVAAGDGSEEALHGDAFAGRGGRTRFCHIFRHASRHKACSHLRRTNPAEQPTAHV
jgi:hypothetical protein